MCHTKSILWKSNLLNQSTHFYSKFEIDICWLNFCLKGKKSIDFNNRQVCLGWIEKGKKMERKKGKQCVTLCFHQWLGSQLRRRKNTQTLFTDEHSRITASHKSIKEILSEIPRWFGCDVTFLIYSVHDFNGTHCSTFYIWPYSALILPFRQKIQPKRLGKI